MEMTEQVKHQLCVWLEVLNVSSVDPTAYRNTGLGVRVLHRRSWGSATMVGLGVGACQATGGSMCRGAGRSLLESALRAGGCPVSCQRWSWWGS